MTRSWPLVPLREVVTPVQRPEVPTPGVVYRQLGVRWWGEGAYEREPVNGGITRYTHLFRAEAGDLILNKIWARHGSVAVVQPALAGTYGSNEFPMFTPRADRIEPTWLHWFSKTEGLWRQLDSASQGTSGKNRIRPERILDIVVPLPPLHEQQQVLRRIGVVAAGLEARATAVKEAGAEMDALLRSVFTQITAGAPRRRMGDVAPLVRRPVTIEPDGSYPELGIRSFGKGTFHKPALSGLQIGSKRLFRIEAGDLLFSNVFAWEGAVAVARVDDAGRFGSHRFITCVAKPDQASASFLRYYFLTPEGLQRLGDASPGGAGRNRTLALEGLAEINVPLPDPVTQEWFDALQAEAAKASTARAEADAVAAKLLPTLLAETFSGCTTSRAEHIFPKGAMADDLSH